MRDQHTSQIKQSLENSSPGTEPTPQDEQFSAGGLSDSFWYFDGTSIQCWPDFQDLLNSVANDETKDAYQPIPIPVDFYPLAIVLRKAVALGLEPELSQRRGLGLAHFRFLIRVRATPKNTIPVLTRGHRPICSYLHF